MTKTIMITILKRDKFINLFRYFFRIKRLIISIIPID